MEKKPRKLKPRTGGPRERFTDGICYCCGKHPIASGNLRLCAECYEDPYSRICVSEEEAFGLHVKVVRMEKVPPTPVTIYSKEDWTQKELRAIIDGGKK